MKFRFTMNDLKTNTDNHILRALVAERLGELNPYAPLAVRLKKIYNNLDRIVLDEMDKKHMQGVKNALS